MSSAHGLAGVPGFKPAQKIYRDWMIPYMVPGDHPYTQWFKKA